MPPPRQAALCGARDFAVAVRGQPAKALGAELPAKSTQLQVARAALASYCYADSPRTCASGQRAGVCSLAQAVARAGGLQAGPPEVV